MSSFIDRHKDAHDDMTSAVDQTSTSTQATKVSCPRSNDKEDGSESNKEYVTTMLPPRKKARKDDGSAPATMTGAMTAWLSSLGSYIKSTLSFQSSKKSPPPPAAASSSASTKAGATAQAAAAAKPSAAQKQTATPKKTHKKSTTASTTPSSTTTGTTTTTPASNKKPRQPRRCFVCMKLYGDEQMALVCPGKQNRTRCTNFSKVQQQ